MYQPHRVFHLGHGANFSTAPGHLRKSVCLYRAGRDDIDSDVWNLDFLRDRLRQAHDRDLGGGIWRKVRIGISGPASGKIYDAPESPLLHSGEYRLHEI